MSNIVIVTHEVDGEEVQFAAPTAKEARAYCVENKLRPAKDYMRKVTMNTLPRRNLLCALFNREGYEAPPPKPTRKRSAK